MPKSVQELISPTKPRSQALPHWQESKAIQAALVREIRSLNVWSWIISISGPVAKLPDSRFIAISKIAGIESLRDSRLLVMDQSSIYVGDKRVLSQVARDVDYQFPHYRHMNSRHEPLLWLPDIIACCYGRGGTWRDAVEQLVTEVIEL